MSQQRIYSLTSIGRPLDPGYVTNKAVLILMPLAALTGSMVAIVQGRPLSSIALMALLCLLTVFASWALARELSPDDNPAAFISMTLAFLVCLFTNGADLLLLVVALFLVRIVNRSTGLKARPIDSILVLIVSLWAMFSLNMPWLGFAAGAAFLIDAIMSDPLHRHYLFAFLCLAGGLTFLVKAADYVVMSWTGFGIWYGLPGIICGLFLISILLLRRLQSVSDIGGQPLTVARVRAGMLIGLLITQQAIMSGPEVLENAGLLLATLAGIVLGSALQYLNKASE